MNGFFYWEYDQAADCLMLCSDATQRKIRTALKGEMLCQQALSRCDCETEDFLFYSQIIDLIEYSDLITPSQLEFIAYTAVAARLFLLPIQPKSWFFEFAPHSQPQNQSAESDWLNDMPAFVQTTIKQNQQPITLLAVGGDGDVVDCLLLEAQLELPGLRLQFGQPLRIFNNRLQPSAIAVQSERLWQQQYA
ncbi:cell division protein ZapC domain-containing protein [Pasteurella testudinis]|nr:cell division protein ZapC domain-containing protein [Pasteurella testudinis]